MVDNEAFYLEGKVLRALDCDTDREGMFEKVEKLGRRETMEKLKINVLIQNFDD